MIRWEALVVDDMGHCSDILFIDEALIPLAVSCQNFWQLTFHSLVLLMKGATSLTVKCLLSGASHTFCLVNAGLQKFSCLAEFDSRLKSSHLWSFVLYQLRQWLYLQHSSVSNPAPFSPLQGLSLRAFPNQPPSRKFFQDLLSGEPDQRYLWMCI